MSIDLQGILESKCVLRGKLATQSIVEKLRFLDVMRERELAIRGQTQPACVRPSTSVCHDDSGPPQSQKREQ